ncbi:SRPBCC family protein [Wenxinia saemankumensis]|uniref:Carbon monoxide dehydrogenase subunit G n=1 Tax=Wenxinia saemankumensis TaxID=1447782 RepID=A0A1M6D2I5_9RHOB|nr:SRPBCC family protein [Wenxinia saemankumensis]SHI67450.1 Carbon monoxide dehydrogenase subunit G [Wenxinia saemankumensis]
MRVALTHRFDAPPARVWASATDLGHLRAVCAGLVAFDDRVPRTGRIRQGDVYVTGVRLFGRLPPQDYRMEVAELDDSAMTFRSEESGAGVRRWTHRLAVLPDGAGARIEESIEIEAGAATPLMALWARLLYRLRARRRRALLTGG